MKKKIIIIVIILVILLIGSGILLVFNNEKKYEYLDSIQVTYSESTLYSQQDFEYSIEQIKQKFNRNGSMKKYKLKSIEYIGDEETLEYGNIQYVMENLNKMYNKGIVYRINYQAPESAIESYSPNENVLCRWILGTDDGINWKFIHMDETSF